MHKVSRRPGGCGTTTPRRIPFWLSGTFLILVLAVQPAEAGKLSWLDEVVRSVIAETRATTKPVIRGGEAARLELRAGSRLFAEQEAGEGLERLIRRSEELASAGRRAEPPAEALLHRRFVRLLHNDPEVLRSFSALAPAEKRLVVELGETAAVLARKYPDEIETMIRQLGPEGLTAVRVFGDDVAVVLAREGPESLNVLRKTGKGGWNFFTQNVLPHKKKLAAAGVLAAFLANPEKFVDYAGQATELAVREFANAGISLAAGMGGGAARGLESSIGRALSEYGLAAPIFRYLGVGLSALVVFMSLVVLLGFPLRCMLLPLGWPSRLVRRLRSSARSQWQ